MCNRFRQVKTKENLSLIFNARPLLDRPEPRDELYPKYPGAIIRKEAGERVLDVMPWGIPLGMKGKHGQPLAPKPVTNVRNLSSGFWKSTIARTDWCWRDDGVELNCAMVKSGTALRWPKYDRERRLCT